MAYPLEAYFGAFERAGFVIEVVREPWVDDPIHHRAFEPVALAADPELP